MEDDSKTSGLTLVGCLVCRRPRWRFFVRKNNCNLYRCSVCGLIRVHPLPPDWQKVYSRDYFFGAAAGLGYADYDADKEAMRDIFHKYLALIEKLLPQKGSLLDIGAATGFFMQLARGRGWLVRGVEVSADAARLGQTRGLDIEVGLVQNIVLPAGSFDLVTMWDVLEHLPDPVGDLRRVWRCLKPGGVLAINTPDSGSWTARLLGPRWHLLVPPEHLFLFTAPGLVSLLRQSGFEVMMVSKISKKFSLPYIFKILHRWQGWSGWQRLFFYFNRGFGRRFAVPINLRDNVFVVVQKPRNADN